MSRTFSNTDRKVGTFLEHVHGNNDLVMGLIKNEVKAGHDLRRYVVNQYACPQCSRIALAHDNSIICPHHGCHYAGPRMYKIKDLIWQGHYK